MHIDDDILNLVAQGDYFDAARLLQSLRGVSLDEAAAEINRLRGDITPLDPASAANPITPAIAEAACSGYPIEAIKLYREIHGVGLKEGKEAVERYIEYHGIERPERVPVSSQKRSHPSALGIPSLTVSGNTRE